MADLFARQGRARRVNFEPRRGHQVAPTAEQLKLPPAIDMVHIPYLGGGPATMAARAHGGCRLGGARAGEPLDQGLQVSGLAVTGPALVPLPDVPTIIESGFPVSPDTFNALFFAPRERRRGRRALARRSQAALRRGGARQRIAPAIKWSGDAGGAGGRLPPRSRRQGSGEQVGIKPE